MSDSIGFDRAADFYDETRGFPPGAEHNAAEIIARVGKLTPQSRMLEIGVGTGRVALPVSQHVGSIVGLDLSRRMMLCLLEKQTTETIYLTQGDATQLPFPDHTFDAAMAVHVLHLIPGWQTVLDELKRVLRPNARLVHAWGDGRQSALWHVWREAVPRLESVGANRIQYDTFLADAGWHLADKNTFIYRHQHAPQVFIDWLRRRVFSNTWRLSDEEIAHGVAAVEAAARELYDDITQPVPVEVTFNIHSYLPPS